MLSFAIKNPSVRRAASGMIKLAVGSGASKVIGLVSLPLITRLYTPDDFGVLAVFTAIMVTMVPLITFQYNQAIPLPRRDGTAINLVCLAVLLMTASSLILFLILGLTAAPIFSALSMDALVSYWWLIVLGVFAVGMASVMKMWGTRQRAFGVIAIATTTQSALGNATKIGLGFLSPQPFGLLIGQVVTESGGLILLVRRFGRDMRRLFSKVSVRRMTLVAGYYRSFPIFRMPSQTLATLAHQLPVFFIAAVYGAGPAGQFGLAMFALSLPLNLIGRSIGQAYYAEIARLGKRADADIRASMVSMIKILGSIGLGMAAAVYLVSPLLFPLVFGAEWTDAGRYAALLSLILAFRFVSAPLVSVLSVFRREDAYFKLDLQRLIIVSVVFGIAYMLQMDITHTILFYSVASSLHHLSAIRKIYLSARQSER